MGSGRPVSRRYREPLFPEDVAALARRTAGWAAYLQLFHLATARKPYSERRRVLSNLATRSRLMQEYLTRHVLTGLSRRAAGVPDPDQRAAPADGGAVRRAARLGRQESRPVAGAGAAAALHRHAGGERCLPVPLRVCCPTSTPGWSRRWESAKRAAHQPGSPPRRRRLDRRGHCRLRQVRGLGGMAACSAIAPGPPPSSATPGWRRCHPPWSRQTLSCSWPGPARPWPGGPSPKPFTSCGRGRGGRVDLGGGAAEPSVSNWRSGPCRNGPRSRLELPHPLGDPAQSARSPAASRRYPRGGGPVRGRAWPLSRQVTCGPRPGCFAWWRPTRRRRRDGRRGSAWRARSQVPCARRRPQPMRSTRSARRSRHPGSRGSTVLPASCS